MPFVELEHVEQREVVPGCRARFVHSESMTISYWDLEAGAVIPDHSHPHEQISTIVTGEMEVTVGHETKLMPAGDGGGDTVGRPARRACADGVLCNRRVSSGEGGVSLSTP